MLTAADLPMQEADDNDLFVKAKSLDRLFVSRDKDFGTLVFLNSVSAPGVIFLRVEPTAVNEVHHELVRLLREQSEQVLRQCYCVVEPPSLSDSAFTHLNLRASVFADGAVQQIR